MVSTVKLELDVEVKTSADKFWESIRDSATLFLKVFPEQIKSIEVLEGDGKGVGTIKVVKYAEGITFVTISKEKIEAFDEEKKALTYSVIDGEIMKFYKSFKSNVHVSAKADGGSLVKWSCELEKASEEAPDPSVFRGFALKTFQDLDAYLLKA